jgi:hypothetical protein
MAQIEIRDPALPCQKLRTFDVLLWSDARPGSAVSCTISNGAFTQTRPSAVTPSHSWTVKLGDPYHGLIPIGTNYTIKAELTNVGGSDSVTGIEIVSSLPLEYKELKKIERDGVEELRIDGVVGTNPAFDALAVEVHAYGMQRGPTVVSCGWIQPLPENGKWRIALPAPKEALLVVHTFGVKTGNEKGGKVVVHVSERVE